MNTHTPHILIVDDHQDIRDLLAKYLRKSGFRVSVARDGKELRQTIKTSQPNLVVLDIMMPGEDGLSLCRWLRETSNLPIILLTAMADETDRIIGLEIGADDYVTKPFNPRELFARIKAVLRRSETLPHTDIEIDKRIGQNRYQFGRWTANLTIQELTDENGVVVALSSLECKLLSVFLKRPKLILNRDQILDLTRGRDLSPFDRSVDNAISRLRLKLEHDPKRPEYIITHWGAGYSFAADVKRLDKD